MRHLPHAPGWTCRACGELWLCDGGKAELVNVYGDEPRSPAFLFFLDHMFRLAVSNYRTHGCPRPVDVSVRMYGWLVGRAAVPSWGLINDWYFPKTAATYLNQRELGGGNRGPA